MAQSRFVRLPDQRFGAADVNIFQVEAGFGFDRCVFARMAEE